MARYFILLFSAASGHTNGYWHRNRSRWQCICDWMTDASDFPTTPGIARFTGQWNLSDPLWLVCYQARFHGPEDHVFRCDCWDHSVPRVSVLLPKPLGLGIAVDGSGNALVAGSSNTADLPVPTGSSERGAFVFKINAAGNEVVYLTFLGQCKLSTAIFTLLFPATSAPIGADASGNAYVAGFTTSADFPATPGAYQTTSGAIKDSL